MSVLASGATGGWRCALKIRGRQRSALTGAQLEKNKESCDHGMGLYHGITRYTCLPPELGVVQRTPLPIPGGGIRPLCWPGWVANRPDLVELDGGNVPCQETWTDFRLSVPRPRQASTTKKIEKRRGRKKDTARPFIMWHDARMRE